MHNSKNRTPLAILTFSNMREMPTRKIFVKEGVQSFHVYNNVDLMCSYTAQQSSFTRDLAGGGILSNRSTQAHNLHFTVKSNSYKMPELKVNHYTPKPRNYHSKSQSITKKKNALTTNK